MRRLKNKYILLILVIILSISSVFLIFKLRNKEVSYNVFNNETSYATFNEKEQKIADLIYNKLNIYSYFDTDNFDSFEILNMESYGYYESQSNIKYVKVIYESKCKDGTNDCDELSIYNTHNFTPNEDEPLFFYVKVDVDTLDYIEKIDGIAAHINSDWVSEVCEIK